MPYAEGRIFNDADSHFMETKDWLFQYADPKVRSKLAPIDFSVCGGQATEDLVTALPGIIERRKKDPAAMARAEDKILERKSWHALGGYDPDERRRALDLLGYNRQLVFTGMASSQFWGVLGVQRYFDPEILYGGARAHNRAISDFCSHDRRLRAVGFLPLEVPELALREMEARCATDARRYGFLRLRRPRCRQPIQTWTWCGPNSRNWTSRSLPIWVAARFSCAKAFSTTASI